MAINNKVLTEQCKRDIKYCKLYAKFKPNLKADVMTLKFYAKHDVVEETRLTYLAMVTRFHQETSKEKYPYPIAENQRYGWFQEPKFDLDRKDERLYHPTIVTEDINIQCEINQILAKEPFKRAKFIETEVTK